MSLICQRHLNKLSRLIDLLHPLSIECIKLPITLFKAHEHLNPNIIFKYQYIDLVVKKQTSPPSVMSDCFKS